MPFTTSEQIQALRHKARQLLRDGVLPPAPRTVFAGEQKHPELLRALWTLDPDPSRSPARWISRKAATASARSICTRTATQRGQLRARHLSRHNSATALPEDPFHPSENQKCPGYGRSLASRPARSLRLAPLLRRLRTPARGAMALCRCHRKHSRAVASLLNGDNDCVTRERPTDFSYELMATTEHQRAARRSTDSGADTYLPLTRAPHPSIRPESR